jgi:hypothetical protein
MDVERLAFVGRLSVNQRFIEQTNLSLHDAKLKLPIRLAG